jgi:tartrate dehydratase alpha subunit/fumarate hydratase class I-like protein
MEQEILKMTQSLGVGAQFGGKYFCHDVRVIRCRATAPRCRSGSACPARPDRQVLGKITRTASISRSSSTTRRNICRQVEQRSAARWSRSTSTSR